MPAGAVQLGGRAGRGGTCGVRRPVPGIFPPRSSVHLDPQRVPASILCVLSASVPRLGRRWRLFGRNLLRVSGHRAKERGHRAKDKALVERVSGHREKDKALLQLVSWHRARERAVLLRVSGHGAKDKALFEVQRGHREEDNAVFLRVRWHRDGDHAVDVRARRHRNGGRPADHVARWHRKRGRGAHRQRAHAQGAKEVARPPPRASRRAV